MRGKGQYNLKITRTKQVLISKQIKQICEDGTYNVKILHLTDNKLIAKGLKYLQSANWNSLINLTIAKNLIGDKGCKYISRCKFPKLQTLNLNSNKIDGEGILALSKKDWGSLRLFSVASNKLSVQSLKWISRFKFCKLQCIIFEYNPLTGAEAVNLVLLNANLRNLDLHTLSSYTDTANIQVKYREILRGIIRQKFPYLESVVIL